MSTTQQSVRDVSEFLADPASYSDRSTQVDVIETHISVVYLTRCFAFKRKKIGQIRFPGLLVNREKRTCVPG